MSDTVRIRFDDGRIVVLPRATPGEAWEAAMRAHFRGLDVAGAWQGVRAAEGIVLVPVDAVVEPMRTVR